MDTPLDRRALKAEYRARRPDAAVYRLVNTRTGKFLLGTAVDIESLRKRVQFAQQTGSPGALDGRLAADIREFGIDAFTLEVLEIVRPAPEQDRAALLADLAVHEQLWREELAGGLFY